MSGGGPSNLFLIVASGALITIATVFAVQGLYHWGQERDLEIKNASGTGHDVVVAEQHAASLLVETPAVATDPSVTDPALRRYRISIDRAKRLTAARLATGGR